jgi:hypothetical protein
MTIRSSLFVLCVLLAPALAAAQDAPPTGAPPAFARCFEDPDRWTYHRGQETIAKAGERFFEDMRKCDPSFAAAVAEAVRFQVHQEETNKFVRSSKYVMAAYGVAWAVLALAGLALWLRQRRLNDEIASLEAKLRDAEAQGR